MELNDTFDEPTKEATPEDARKNVVRKPVVQVAENGNPGTVAHYHRKENAVETWDEPCYFVKHHITDPKGFAVNERRYVGDVVVPQCLKDHLAWQEAAYLNYEQGIFRSNRINQVIGQR